MAKRLVKFRGTEDYARVELRGGNHGSAPPIAWASCSTATSGANFTQQLHSGLGGGGGGISGVEWLFLLPGIALLAGIALVTPSLSATVALTSAAGAMTAAGIAALNAIIAATGLLTIQLGAMTIAQLLGRISNWGRLLPFENRPQFTQFVQPCGQTFTNAFSGEPEMSFEEFQAAYLASQTTPPPYQPPIEAQ